MKNENSARILIFSYFVCYVFYCMFLCIEIPLNTEGIVEHCVTLS